tara:strand:+ start:56976 stop:57278 length:303 start_codon:yes stop_codon:yes gene_type:complete
MLKISGHPADNFRMLLCQILFFTNIGFQTVELCNLRFAARQFQISPTHFKDQFPGTITISKFTMIGLVDSYLTGIITFFPNNTGRKGLISKSLFLQSWNE